MNQANNNPKPTPVAQYTFDEVATHYNFPDNYGENTSIGILSWGKVGDIGVDIESIKNILSKNGLPCPKYRFHYFGNQINNGSSSDELHMDTSIVSQFCPNTYVNIYIATFETAYQAINQAVTDGCDVTTCSFGIKDGALMDDISAALENAAQNYVTTCFAAGDSGAASGQPGVDEVVFPAGHPNALAVGGTMVPIAAPPQATSCGETPLNVEQVWWNYPKVEKNRPWWASGGGVSKVFPVPDYQANLDSKPGTPLTGRGVPDVAAFAQGLSGDIGTSASTPTIASLILRIVSALGHPVGDIHNTIYNQSLPIEQAFNSITIGCNIPPPPQPGAGFGYQAQPGWDPCTGLGVPNGGVLLGLLNKSLGDKDS